MATQAAPAIVATVLSQSIPVTFVINSQGPAPYNNTFTIGLCSGYLFVNDVSFPPPQGADARSWIVSC